MRAKGFAQNEAGEWVKVSSRPLASVPAQSSAKRIRQNTKPMMNKLETEFFESQLKTMYSTPISIQAISFRLANGLRYTPDFVSLSNLKAWEVKGAWVDGDSFPKLKMAAAVYPEIVWLLVWKKNGVWREQRVLP